MDVREKLVELLKKAKAKEQYDFLFGDIDTAIDMPHGAEYYADFLIANGVTVQEWISVKDRLPEVMCPVLVYGRNDTTIDWLEDYGELGLRWGNLCCGSYYPKYWQPMPQPPKGE